jgi:hypothetical protein
MVRKVVVVGDLHCGSTVGLLPPGFVTLEGQEVRQSALQAWTWARWVEFGDWARGVVGDEPYALVVLGDATEGIHHGGRQTISPEPADHVRAAEMALTPLADGADPVIVVTGTECHTGSTEHGLAMALGAVPDPNTGRPAWDRAMVTVNGCLVCMTHHIGTTSRVWLQGTRMSVYLANLQMECMRAGHPVPRMLVCGHCHVFNVFEAHGAMSVTIPSWQSLTRFGHKAVPTAVPVVGGVVLDWTGKAEGETPTVRARTFGAMPPRELAL